VTQSRGRRASLPYPHFVQRPTSPLFGHIFKRDDVQSAIVFHIVGALVLLIGPEPFVARSCAMSQEQNPTIMNHGIAFELSLPKIAALTFAAVASLASPTPAVAGSGAQSESPHSGPRFEVASIKPAPPLIPGMRSSGMPLGVRIDKVQANFGGMSLAALISYAYGVKLAQISGPDWLATQRFDIVANLPDGASPQQVPEMVQALLAERFDLKLHRESKQFPVYALVAAKTGIKLRPKPEDFDPKAHNDQIAIPVLSLTLLLEQSLGVPVVDETGLQGQYLFPSHVIQQVMSAGRTANAQQPTASAGGGVAEPADSDFTAVLVAAGMKLEKKKANLPVLVVESMRQRPTEN
jgi:uncharacterized protein (TIGR03435 family)